ncbi:hypothetical protein M0805_001406 [Coniferiporia weirii]|nr:hypothetical protein M0805_001406 [Coniferiporia weirii]
MAAPNSRTRSKIALNPLRVVSNSLPVPLLSRLFLSNILLVAALDAGKEWLLSPNTHLGVFWVLIRVLACAGLGVLIWEGLTGKLGKRSGARIEWSVLGMASLLLFVQQASLLTALYRISAIRVVLFTHFSSFWVDTLIHRESVRKTTALILAILFSLLSDAGFALPNIKAAIPGYAVLFIYGLASSGIDHTQGILAPALGASAASMASTLGGTVIALPFYIFKQMIVDSSEIPAVPLVSLLALPVLAYSLLFLTPNTRESVRAVALPAQHFSLSYASTVVPALILGPLAFSQYPSWTDCVVSVLLYYGSLPDSTQTLGGPPRTPATRLAKAYLKTILANPESRKIFYFLVLNLVYMLVQMLYGVWTNSLGLISDAIHMAFDCMAIGMGLFASVMATWPPNERFTYGYGRIETLSGFANGIFLVLISIFIIFEAIQRLLDPPEMNTSQLLLVSSLGLGVNLFGMFAMGGHHHHGHSHGHSHGGDDSHSHGDHGHSHSPTPSAHSHSHAHSPELRIDHVDGHAHEHEHGHGHEHSHSHSPPDHSPSIYHSPEVCGEDHDHDHGHHGHGHGHEHGHEQHYAFPSLEPPNHTHTHSSLHTQLHSDEPNIPMSAPATMTRFHTRSVSLHVPTTQSGLSPPLGGAHSSHPGRHARTPSMAPRPGLLMPGSPDDNSPVSPVTPSYQFGHDAHFALHHDHSHGAHVPNLHDHSHSHGGEHEGHSHNMRGVFLHVMADTLGSVGVIISTLLIQFYGWTGFDPIASLFIAVLIAASVIPLVIDSGKVLCLDIADREDNIKQALAELPTIEGLASYSSPRFWPKDSSSLIGSIHIQIEQSRSSYDPTGPHTSTKPVWTSIERVVERVDTILRNKISGLEELTIQVEGAHDS